jgi:hypothetical protein
MRISATAKPNKHTCVGAYRSRLHTNAKSIKKYPYRLQLVNIALVGKRRYAYYHVQRVENGIELTYEFKPKITFELRNGVHRGRPRKRDIDCHHHRRTYGEEGSRGMQFHQFTLTPIFAIGLYCICMLCEHSLSVV